MHAYRTPQIADRIALAQGEVLARLLPDTIPLAATCRRCPEPVPFPERLDGAWQPIVEGTPWGAGADSAWFHLTAQVPTAWAGQPVTAWIDIGAEGLVLLPDGRPLQGVSAGSVFDDTSWKGNRTFVHLLDPCAGGEAIELWLEGACLSHPGSARFEEPIPMPLPQAGFPNGVAHRLRLARWDATVWELWLDLDVLASLQRELCEGPRRARIIAALDQACVAIHRHDHAGARAVLAPVLASPASASDLVATAIGHAHLDTAWLWRMREGRRKFVRTCANQLRLGDRFPELVFGASSALHYRWLAEDQPGLLDRIRARMAEGRWEALGAMWVEPDCNLTAGESLIRQCLHGRRAFRDLLGCAPDHAWLPDCFGFTGALPQILAHCGVDALVTQKLSWGAPNRLPSQSFTWEGVDGTGIVVHFPPENTYSSTLDAGGLAKAQAAFPERDTQRGMLSLVGNGDGGGGPTERHLGRARRLADLEGCPRVRWEPAGRFLDRLRAERPRLPVWRGELYVEAHRGTLTTNARLKSSNRRCEQTLLALEILHATAARDGFPQADLDRLWERVLTLQFHDILPGSSIGAVTSEAHAAYDAVLAEAATLADAFARAQAPAAPDELLLFNSLSTPWTGLLRVPAALAGVPCQQADGATWAQVTVPPLSFAACRLAGAAPAARPLAGLVLANAHARYVFAADGRLIAGHDLRRDRPIVPDGRDGCRLALYHDHPPQWDAWDLHPAYEREELPDAVRLERVAGKTGAAYAALRFAGTIGGSPARLEVRLAHDDALLTFRLVVDWRETHRLLRVRCAVAVATDQASTDIPFGIIRRSIHRNTSWDEARFEVPGHRFTDLSEPDWGVALLNDGKYGHSAHRDELGLSLLRAPVFPDPQADRHEQTMTWALLPHGGLGLDPAVEHAAAALNRAPFQWPGRGRPGLTPPVRLDSASVLLESITRAPDGAAWIVRVAEHAGRRGTGLLHAAGRITPCDAAGSPLGPPVASPHALHLRPGELAGFRIAD